MQQQSSPAAPLDADILQALLKQHGVKDFEPRVVPQLLEFMHSLLSFSFNTLHFIKGYLVEVFRDAQCYAEHAMRTDRLELDDIKLAIQSRVEYSFTRPPDIEACFTCLYADTICLV